MKKIKSRCVRIRRKKFLKWGILVVLVISLLGNVGNVSAGMNDSMIERNRLDGVYAVTTLNGQQRIFYLNMYRMNGRPSYCIDMGVDITTDVYHSTDDFSVSYLSSEQIEYIRSISYFGYQYLGHDDYRYYMAAQELIWEYLSNTNVEWTNVLDVNGERINIDYYKTDILELRNQYYKQVEFNWIDNQSYYGGDTITLQDSAQVLSGYEIISSGHSKAIIDNNSLNIGVSSDYVGGEEIILKKKNYYNYDSVLYYYEDSQRLISNGNYRDIVKKLSFSIVGRNMNVQLIDRNTNSNIPMGQATLQGAIYELYNEKRELIGTYESSYNGSFSINNLPYGIYYFKQIKPSEGYTFKEKEVQVYFYNEKESVRLLQDVIFNTIEINKVYGSNNVYVPEEKIYFEVIDWNGDIYSKVFTNKKGMTRVKLPYGVYTINQVNTTWGYSKVQPFEVNVHEVKNKYVYYNLVDDLIQYKVKINTIDADSGKQLLKDDIVYRIKVKGEDSYVELDGNSEFVASSDGSLVFPMLFTYGDYVLEQVDVPLGVVINSESLEFSINEQTDIKKENDEMYVVVDVYNQLTKGKLELLAREEIFYTSMNDYGYQLNSMENVEFSLIANNDIIVNGEKIYSLGEEVQKIITNEKGMAEVENLYLGDYCLVEVGTEKSECFSFESVSNKEVEVVKKIEFTKLLDKADIFITNRDDGDQVVVGSVFEIYDGDDTLIYTGITNEEGIIRVNDLTFGEYCIRQKRVPDEWQLNSDNRCISLQADFDIEFVNQRLIKRKIWVPNTFSSKSSFKFVLCIIGLIGIIIFGYKKIFSHH